MENIEILRNTLVPLEHELTVYNVMAKQAVESKFYRAIGDASAVMTLMLSARELGISPMQAINGGLNIIQGKVEISARLMNAMIRRAGHSIKTIESTENACRLHGRRKDNGDEEEVVFTIEDAKKAGLYKPGGGWTKYPSDMLYARALSRLARRLFPDVIGCAYVEGEIQDVKYEIVKEPQGKEEPKEDLMTKFYQEFDDEHIKEYVELVQESFGLTESAILQKFYDDPEHFKGKFNEWKKKKYSN